MPSGIGMPAGAGPAGRGAADGGVAGAGTGVGLARVPLPAGVGRCLLGGVGLG